MAKGLHFSRIRRDRRELFAKMRRPIRSNYKNDNSYRIAYQNWWASYSEYHLNNIAFSVKLISRVIIVFIVVALIFMLYNKSFNAYDFASNLLQQNFAPFDYEQFVQLVDDSFSSLPSWMGGLKGISQVLVSIGYTFFWFFGLLKYLITIP